MCMKKFYESKISIDIDFGSVIIILRSADNKSIQRKQKMLIPNCRHPRTIEITFVRSLSVVR